MEQTKLSPEIKSFVMTALEKTDVAGDANINQIGQVLAQHVQKFITNTLNVREAQFQEADIRNLFLNSKAEINVKNINTTALAEQIAKNLNAQSEQLQALAKQEKMQQLIQSIKQKYLNSNELPDMLGGPTLTLKEGCYVNLALIKSDEQIAKEQSLRKQSKLDSESPTNHTQRDNRLSSFEDIHRPKDPLPLNELFVTQSDKTTDTTADNPIQRVLMLGRAGIGKSTLCQYLAYRWADDTKTKEEAWLEKYDVLLWIKLRELISLQESLKEQHKRCGVADVVTISCVFGLDSSNEVFLTQAVNELIHDSTKTILWVLDGFDEVAHLYGNAQHPLHTVLHELFPRAATPAPLHQVLLTSRPYATQGLQVDRTIENIGLLDKDIPRYVTQYFNKLSKPNPDLGKKVAAQIKANPNIHGMAHVPINAYLICHLYQKESSSQQEDTSLKSVTLTQLYQRLVVDLCKRMVNQPQSYPPESNNHPNRLLRLHDKTLIHRYQKPLWVLAHLAFRGLTQTQSLTLPWRLQDHILDTLDYEVDDYVNHVLPLGLLKTICETSEDTTEAPRYFMHLTFQEFFAALYLVWSLAEYGQATSKHKDQALNFLKNEKYTPRYQVIFWFAAGLVRHATWFNNDDTIQQTALTNLWEKGLLSEPQDITGYGQFHLLAHAFEEGGEPTSLSTSSQDNPINTAWTFIEDAIDKTLVGQIIDNKHSRLFKPLFTTLTVCPHLSNNHAQILVKYLQHDNWDVRQSAIYALAQLHVTDPLTIQLIAERLTDDNENVRQSAINVLARLNGTDLHILQCIVERLTDDNWDVRNNAIYALTELNVTDPHILQRIAERLDDDSWSVRDNTFNALAQLNVTDPHILQHIAEYLKHEDPNARQSAINALAKLHVTDIHILQRIAERLTDDTWYVRNSAINALAQLNVTDPHILQHIAEYLKHEDPNARQSAINALAQLNVTDTYILQRIAEYLKHDNWFVRNSAIKALAKLKVTDTHILQRIAEYLQHEDPDVRYSAIHALAKLDVTDIHILQRIAERLTDDKWRVRHSAIKALAKLDVTDIHILQRIVKRLTDDNENIRYSAIYALAKLDVTDIHILQRIAERLTDDKWRIRHSAIYALAQLHITDSHILQRIAERLDDNEPDVRFHAIHVLAQLNVTDPHILQHIAERLTDDDWDVRKSAINALAQLNVTDIHILQRIAERLTDDDSEVRKSAINALAQLNVTDIHILQRIIERLTDDDWDVRKSAIHALAQLNVTDAHILQRIAEYLKQENPKVRDGALNALAQLNITDAHILQRIAEHLTDNQSDVRKSAIHALAQLNITDIHILQRIAERLTDDDSEVRKSAINALAQLNITDIHILQRIAERLTDDDSEVRKSAGEALNRLQPHLTMECWLPLWDKRLTNHSKGALSAITAHHFMVAWIDKHFSNQTNCHLASNASLLKISRLFAKWIFNWLQLPLLIDENQHTLNMITNESADKLTIRFPHHPLGQTAFKQCKQALELESLIHPITPFSGYTHSHIQHLKPEHRFNALQQHLEHYLTTNEDFDSDYVVQHILHIYASLFEQKPELLQGIINLVLKHPANHLFTKNPILHHTYKTTLIQTIMEARNKIVDDLIAKGKEYSSKAKLDKAIQQYEQAVTSSPNHFKPYHNLASLYQAKAHSVAADEASQYCELAEYTFNQALKLNPTPELYTKYGQFLYIQKRYEKALPLLTQAIKTTPDVTKINLSYHSLELPTLDTTLQNWLQNHRKLKINSAQLAYYLKYRCYEILGQTQQQAAWLNQWAEWLTSLPGEHPISQHLITTCQNEQAAATAIHPSVNSDTTETNDESPIHPQTQPLVNQLSTTEKPLTTAQPALQTTSETSSAEAVIHKYWQHIMATSLGHPAGSFNPHPLLSTPLPSSDPTRPSNESTSDNKDNTTQSADTLSPSP